MDKITRTKIRRDSNYPPQILIFSTPSLLHIHAGNGANQQLVAVVERDLALGHRTAESGQVVRGAEEIAQVQQQLEVRQLIRERPALLAHPKNVRVINATNSEIYLKCANFTLKIKKLLTCPVAS